jgi:hypothetical protein
MGPVRMTTAHNRATSSAPFRGECDCAREVMRALAPDDEQPRRRLREHQVVPAHRVRRDAFARLVEYD